jgi:aspartyl-tRNA(Asn)/glutamyl-tRNA(Gln) amidotransferase subunit A
MTDPDWSLSASACAQAVRNRVVSAREVAGWTLDRIASRDGKLGAFSEIDEAGMLRAADAVDANIARGSAGALPGVPIGIKELVDVRGMHTSYASPAFRPYKPRTDASSVAALRRGGALIPGKTRTSELAWSPITSGTRNPVDATLTCGASSGGSAAAVAGGLVPAALGTDTGGSVRLPASLCGAVGMKPTFGLVSRAGVLPASWSLDTVGVVARNVLDVRLVLAALCASDGRDPGRAPQAQVDHVRTQLLSATRTPAALRLGVLDEPLLAIADERGARMFEAAIQAFEATGAHVRHVTMPELRFVPPALLAIDLAEGAALHRGLLRDHADRLDPDVRALLRTGLQVTGATLARAHQARHAIRRLVSGLFGAHALDALLVPSHPAPIPSLNEVSGTEPALWAFGRVAWLANLTGQPAVVLPTRSYAPPLGVQLVGRPFEDARLLDVAQFCEREVLGTLN